MISYRVPIGVDKSVIDAVPVISKKPLIISNIVCDASVDHIVEVVSPDR